MASIFTYEVQDIDLKECIKVKINCQQSDTMVLQFNIFDYDIPVDLINYNVSFIAKKPSGIIYGQVENITKSNNFLSISCDSQLVSETGRVVSNLVITDNLGNRKGSYFVVFNVFGIINDEDRVVSKNFVDVLDRFDEDIIIASSLEKNFENNIEITQGIIEDLTTKIPEATLIDTTLNTTIDTATPLELKLANDIAIGTPLATNLETNLTMASTVKDELILASATANIDKDTLITTISNADIELQKFKNYDTTELVPLSNTMLNEMYCNKELLSINHGLNGYPIAKMTYTEFGSGVGGAGDFPASADSDCNLMQNKAIYTDNNNMKIFVPQNYYIASPIINKINNHKYIVTFLNSTRSLLIELIEGSVSEDILNINKSISDLNYQNAQGTSTAITLTINKILSNGYSLTFIASANNNGSSTTINGKPLYKPNTTTSPNLISGKAYTVWYNLNGDCFFFKASAEGDANVNNVLATKKFSNDDDTNLIGLMPNNGALNSTISTAGGTYIIPLGYTSGGVITAPDLATVTSEGTVTNNNQLLNGYKCISDGVLYTGNIPSKIAQIYSPSTSVQTIASGQYISETQTISATIGTANIVDVVVGKTFNSANGIGLTGTATIESLGGRQHASGSSEGNATVNLPFTPTVVTGHYNSGSEDWYGIISPYFNAMRSGTNYSSTGIPVVSTNSFTWFTYGYAYTWEAWA